MTAHPFSTRKGRAFRQRVAAELFAEQLGRCKTCGQPINPTLAGIRDPRSAVVDHVIPWRLRPDLAFRKSNLRLTCKGCHDTHDQAIERAHGSDADMIAEAKARMGQEW